MITDDDARSTLEIADRYAICPPFAQWQSERLTASGARPVDDGFRYSSDANADWLDGRGLLELIGRA